ncbi:MAG TPA: hypothetical protein VLB01_06165 [Thermodesulfobacteriota bacterium]|nr:hypothetical protein [Thermodesulfobacteriota bacterium]
MEIKNMDFASLKAFFGKLVRMSLFDLGMQRDSQVTSYLAEVLTDFAKADKLYKIADTQGKKIDTIVDMLLEIKVGHQENSEWEREMRKYIGDFTLFMTGIFRDHITKGSYLRYYINEGTKSYFLVSKFDIEMRKGNPIMFTMLSKDFEFYSGALDYMKKVYFSKEKSGDPFSNFIEQLPKGIKH